MEPQVAILANIFLAVQNQLVAGVPELKFIDLDTHQLEYKDAQERPMVLLPCVLIDFITATFTDDSQNIQEGDALMQLRLGVDPFTQATQYFTDTQKANAINYFNIEHKINMALHGWCNSQYFTPMSRVALKSELRNDKLRVRVMHYKFGYTDWTAQPLPAEAIARPDLVIEAPNAD
jgi:hypothetical protein